MRTKLTFNTGQDKVISDLSSYIEFGKKFKRVEIDNQANVILIFGPTGAGKTFSVREALDLTGESYFIADMKQFSEVGYEGKNVLDIFSDFWIQENYDSDKIENGVVVFDEFDKLQSNFKNLSHRDIGGLGIQQSLLKLIDGISVRVSSERQSRTHPDATVNTKNMTFVLIGAFDNLRDYYESSEIKWRETLKNNGFLSELVDRVSFLEYVKGPTEEDFTHLMISEDGLFKKANSLFEEIENPFRFHDEDATDILKLTYGEENDATITSYRTLLNVFKKIIVLVPNFPGVRNFEDLCGKMNFKAQKFKMNN